MGPPGPRQSDAIEAEKRKAKIAILLERFKENPAETRHAMRVELGYLDDLAAEMFALVVFVSDGLLRVNDTTPSGSSHLPPSSRWKSKWCCATV